MDDLKQIDYMKNIDKIMDIPEPCTHPEHEIPGHIVLSPGVYQHRCPHCLQVTIFTVPRKFKKGENNV
jgi:hypothetical protein